MICLGYNTIGAQRATMRTIGAQRVRQAHRTCDNAPSAHGSALVIEPGLAATTPRFTHDSTGERSVMTETSLSQQNCPIAKKKKNDPKEMGRHGLVS